MIKEIPYTTNVNRNWLYGHVGFSDECPDNGEPPYAYTATVNNGATHGTILTVGVFHEEDDAKKWIKDTIDLMVEHNSLTVEAADDYEKDRMI